MATIHDKRTRYNEEWRIIIARGHLLGIKHQGPNLDGLSLGGVGGTGAVMESRVRRQTCLVDVGVEALDEGHFVWGLVRQVIPLVSRIVLDAERGTLAMSINVAGCYEVFIGIDGAVVRYRERVVGHGVGNRSRRPVSGCLMKCSPATHLQTLIIRYRPFRSRSASSPR